MLENTTVTLPLDDFDRLRWAEREYKKIARQLSACFAYTCTENPYPQECKGCPTSKYDYSSPHDRTAIMAEHIDNVQKGRAKQIKDLQ